MPVSRSRTFIASAVALGLAGATIAWSAATAAPGATAVAATRGVIVLLKNQHTDLAIARGTLSPRVAAVRSDQAPLLTRVRQLGAKNVSGFGVINAFYAYVTPAEMAGIARDPAVAAIVPDRIIARPGRAPEANGSATPSATTNTSQICPTDPTKPLLEPEALQTTHTAYMDPSTPQAQNLVTGAGVKVGWIADSLDIND